MAKVSGIFDSFDNLDQIPTKDIIRWLSPRPEGFYLENYLANRLIYPQAIPVARVDLNIELAILREALKRNPTFFKSAEKKILIPEGFVNRLPDLTKLVWAFVDAYLPKELVTVVLVRQHKDEILGSVVVPTFAQPSEPTTITLELTVEGSDYHLKAGSLTVIHCPLDRCQIAFKSKEAKILGKNELIFEVAGGKLGLLIDGRAK